MWLDQLSSHWQRGLLALSGQFTAALGNDEAFKDRCHHRLSWKHEGQRSFNFRMDWQRFFDPPQGLRGRDIKKRLAEFHAPAVAYFEQFGAGLLPEE